MSSRVKALRRFTVRAHLPDRIAALAPLGCDLSVCDDDLPAAQALAGNSALSPVQAVAAIRGALPSGSEAPVVQKFDPNATPILTLALLGGSG